MATLGYTGGLGWDTYYFSGVNTNNMVVAIPTSTTYIMPEAGYITKVWIYAAGDGVSVDSEIFVDYNGTYVVDIYKLLPSGTRSVGGQTWNSVTLSTPYFLPKGATFSVGIWRSPSESLVWSSVTNSGYQWDDGYVSTAPSVGGTLGSHSIHSGSSMGAYIEYTPAAPILSSVDKASGHIGDTVTISGEAFTGTTSVTVNGVGASFTVVSDTQLTVTIPAGAQVGTYTVTNANGPTTSSFTWTTYPTWSSWSASVGHEGDTIDVYGTGLTGLTAVDFNGTSAAYTVVSDSHFTTTVPAGATYGPINFGISGRAASTSNFTVIPTITSFTPGNAAVGQTVTVTGTGFSGTNGAKVNGTAASYSVTNHTTVVVTIPSGATSGHIEIDVPGSSATSAASLNVVTRRFWRGGAWVLAQASYKWRIVGGVGQWVQETQIDTSRGGVWTQDT